MIGYNHEQSDTSTLTFTFSSCDTEDVSISEPCVCWSYLKTHQGYLKAMQMMLSLFGLICFVTTTFASTPYSTLFIAMAISGLTFTGVLLAFHLVGVDQKYPNFLWLETEFAFSGIFAVCNYVSACSIAIFAKHIISKGNALIFAASVFFSFGTLAAYVVDACLKYRAMAARKRIIESLSSTPDPETIIDEITV